MKDRNFEFVAGLPHLDIYTLSEDWALAESLYQHWQILGDMTGNTPSNWLDANGERMYGAVLTLRTEFNLDAPIMEDDLVEGHCQFLSIRKPHAWSRTDYSVDGSVRASVYIMTSFIKRVAKGSNKKFSQVYDFWQDEDYEPEIVEGMLDAHHANKKTKPGDSVAGHYEINRIQDFNTADFLYFKNFIRLAKYHEWAKVGRETSELNANRTCYYYGNFDDGETVETRLRRDGDELITTHHDGTGRVKFLSVCDMEKVTVAER